MKDSPLPSFTKIQTLYIQNLYKKSRVLKHIISEWKCIVMKRLFEGPQMFSGNTQFTQYCSSYTMSKQSGIAQHFV